MIKIDDLFEKKNSRVSIEKIAYDLRGPAPESTSVSFKSEDSLRFEELDKKAVKLCLTRHIYFSPECIFDLSATAYIKLTKLDEAPLNAEALMAYFTQNKSDFLLMNLATRVSLLISQITSAGGQDPIITPPLYQPPVNN